MAWVLIAVTGVLAALVAVLAVVTLRLRGRLSLLEQRLVESPEPVAVPVVRPGPEFVITRVGDGGRAASAASVGDGGRAASAASVVETPAPPPASTVAAPVFADIVARESLIHAASLVAGLRRALAPETRNRIRFHVRQEVKRSRKQRKLELREVRREWAARQREEPAA